MKTQTQLTVFKKAEFIDFADAQINDYIEKDKYLKDRVTFIKYAKMGFIRHTTIISEIWKRFLRSKSCLINDVTYSQIQELIRILGGN